MTVLPAVPEAVRVSILWGSGSDVDILTKLHFAYTGTPPNPAAAAALAADIDDAVATYFPALLNTDSVIRGVEIQDLSVFEGGAAGAHLVTTAGTREGGLLPAGVAAMVNYGIARKYRGGKPRSYLPLLVASDLDSTSAWSAAAATAVNAAVTSLFTDVAEMVEGGCELGGPIQVSYFHGYDTPRPRSNGHLYYPPLPRDTPIVDPLTSWGLNLKPGSQRRRNLQSA